LKDLDRGDILRRPDGIVLWMTWKVWACPERMCSLGINGEGKLWWQPANPGSSGKMAVKTQNVCFTTIWHYINIIIIKNEQA